VKFLDDINNLDQTSKGLLFTTQKAPSKGSPKLISTDPANNGLLLSQIITGHPFLITLRTETIYLKIKNRPCVVPLLPELPPQSADFWAFCSGFCVYLAQSKNIFKFDNLRRAAYYASASVALLRKRPHLEKYQNKDLRYFLFKIKKIARN
jgi:hypothetical protein